MKNVGGVWLPDGETHLVDWMRKKNQVVDGKLTYQWDKQQAAMRWVKRWGTAIDVGGHCGLWSMNLAKRFRNVFAYEPVLAHRECFLRNVDPGSWEQRALAEGWGRGGAKANVELFPYALGEHEGSVSIHTAPTSSGDSWVDGHGDIPMKRLDDEFLHRDGAVDFIKLDCEGYELLALLGADKLLRAAKPCVIVEQKPGRAQKFGLPERGAVDYLVGLGAKLRAEMSGDFILSWD